MTMTPDKISESLSLAFDALPREALLAAGEQKPAMTALFLKEVSDYLASNAEDREIIPNWLFFGAYLMAEWRETSAYRPLCQLLHCPPDEVETLFDDCLTESVPRILASVCDGDPQPLRELILDHDANLWARNAACAALAIAARHGRLDKDAAADALCAALAGLQDGKGKYIWWGMVSAMSDLGLTDMLPTIKRLFDEGYIDPMIIDFETCQQDMRDVVSGNAPVVYCESLWNDTIAEMETWHFFQPDDDMSDEDVADGDWPIYSYIPPRINPHADLGRNDPCFCGSGKKFKKCCLEKAA